MPPKRPSLLEEPPTASSSSEEEEEEDEEEEDHQDREGGEQEEEDDEEDEEDDEQANVSSPPSGDKRPSVKKPPVKVIPPPTPTAGSGLELQSSDDEDDDESGTESGSDSDPSPQGPGRLPRSADPNIKPISSKPMDDGPTSKKPAAKLSAAPSPSAPPAKSKAATKRPAESDKDGSKDFKRRKDKPSDDEEDAGVSEDAEKKTGDDRKKQLFQRLWTEDDELAILKGMLDYYSKRGTDPSADMNSFHDFIKKSFHVEFTRTQLADKIRRLRKKYQNNVGRGKDPVFSKPHEQKAFELSKKIWGAYTANDVLNDQTVSNGILGNKSRKGKNAVGSPQLKAIQPALEVPKVAVKEEKEMDWSMYPHLAKSFLTEKEAWMMHMPRVDDSFVEEGACLVGSSKLKELEQKWRNLRMAEVDLFLKRAELMREQMKLFQDACNPKK